MFRVIYNPGPFPEWSDFQTLADAQDFARVNAAHTPEIVEVEGFR